MVAEAIFNSKIRYGIAVYLNPVYDEEDLKMKKLSQNAADLQTIQNRMIRTVLGINQNTHTNMQRLRENIKIMSIKYVIKKTPICLSVFTSFVASSAVSPDVICLKGKA